MAHLVDTTVTFIALVSREVRSSFRVSPRGRGATWTALGLDAARALAAARLAAAALLASSSAFFLSAISLRMHAHEVAAGSGLGFGRACGFQAGLASSSAFSSPRSPCACMRMR
jgi:hypothetical protein